MKISTITTYFIIIMSLHYSKDPTSAEIKSSKPYFDTP